MVEPLGRPSITLVMKVMTTGVCPLTLVMLLMLVGVPSITLVMGVVLPSQVWMLTMLTTYVVPILLGAASFLGQRIRLPIVVASELLMLSWLPGTVSRSVVGFGV